MLLICVLCLYRICNLLVTYLNLSAELCQVSCLVSASLVSFNGYRHRDLSSLNRFTILVTEFPAKYIIDHGICSSGDAITIS